MPIPASEIVNVTSNAIGSVSKPLEFSGLFLTNSPKLTGKVSFGDVDTVSDFFGALAQETAVAGTYFKGYDNKTSTPRRIMFVKRTGTLTAANIEGGKLALDTAALIASIKLQPTLPLDLTVNGTARNYVLDTSTVADMPTLIAALNAAEDDDNNVVSAVATFAAVQTPNGVYFTLTTIATGIAASIELPRFNAQNKNCVLPLALGLFPEVGGYYTAGSNGIATDLDEIVDTDRNWVTFSFAQNVVSSDDLLDAGNWAKNRDGYLFVAHSDDVALTQDAPANYPLKPLVDAGAGNITAIFGDAHHAAFFMGTIASINWSAPNGLITLAIKSQEGLPPSVGAGEQISATVARNVLAKKWNIYGQYASRNQSFTFAFDGRMFSEKWGFVDNYIGDVWLSDAIQIAFVNALRGNGRINYNASGYAYLSASLASVIERAKISGVIRTGQEIGEALRQSIIAAAGQDISGEIYSNGYFLNIVPATSEERAARQSVNVVFFYANGGAIHSINVQKTLVK